MLVKPRRSANSTTSVCAHIGGREQGIAQLRVLEDLVGEPWRDIAAEGLPQYFLAAPDLRLELRRSDLAAHGPARTSASIRVPESFVSRHCYPQGNYSVKGETSTPALSACKRPERPARGARLAAGALAWRSWQGVGGAAGRPRGCALAAGLTRR